MRDLYDVGKNQVSTFLDNNNGPGVQHVAFHTNDIISTTASLRRRGLSMVHPPEEYYSLPVSEHLLTQYTPTTSSSQQIASDVMIIILASTIITYT